MFTAPAWCSANVYGSFHGIFATDWGLFRKPRAKEILVTGSVVIAFDYFRRFIARIIMLIGGRITLYEDMLDRARREALLRLLEEAEAAGARQVHNVRFEFSRVGSSARGANVGGGAELLAYGTAVL